MVILHPGTLMGHLHHGHMKKNCSKEAAPAVKTGTSKILSDVLIALVRCNANMNGGKAIESSSSFPSP